MSIASQISRLQSIKTSIRNALVSKGIESASTHDMEDFAADIAAIPTGSSGNYQSKSVNPSNNVQVVVPDSNYDALSSVTVNATALQAKSAQLSGSAQVIGPDSGYIGLSQLSVPAVPGNAVENQVLEGATFSSASKPQGASGSIKQLGDYRYIPNQNLQMITRSEYTDGNGETQSLGSNTKFVSIREGCAGYIPNQSNDHMILASRFGDAQPSNTLAGKTFTSGNTTSVAQVGTMPNRGAVSQSLNAGSSYTIPEGYHNGSGKVTANSLASQTQATLNSNYQMLNGVTAWANGSKYTGAIPTRSASTETIDNSKTYYSGYYPNSWTVYPYVPDIALNVKALGISSSALSTSTSYINLAESIANFDMLIFWFGASLPEYDADTDLFLGSSGILTPQYFEIFTNNTYNQRHGMAICSVDSFNDNGAPPLKGRAGSSATYTITCNKISNTQLSAYLGSSISSNAPYLAVYGVRAVDTNVITPDEIIEE